jgi:hypothetical protein
MLSALVKMTAAVIGAVTSLNRHFSIMRLPEVLPGLTDAELGAWPSELWRGEIERRQRGSFKAK